MPDLPGSPRAHRLAAPRWLDGRLVLGVLLVLVSVVVGARVLSSADRSQLVWAVTGDLAAGSQLQADDLRQVRVRLFESGPQYVGADGDAPVGYVVRRGLGAGELLPRDALGRPEADVDFRAVTVPVQVGHFPPSLQADQQVDVWLTPEPAGGPAADRGPDGRGNAAGRTSAAGTLPLGGAQQVLSEVAVLAGPVERDFAATGAAVPIVLNVRPGDVARLMSAMSLGRIDVVRVPRAAEASGGLAPPTGAG